MSRKHSTEPIVITFDEAGKRKIVQRLKVPLLAVAITYDQERLAKWLEQQVLVEAWQFIELPPKVLRARSQGCGKQKIDELNATLTRLKLPPIGVQFDAGLIKLLTQRSVNDHPYENLLEKYANDPDMQDEIIVGMHQRLDEAALIAAMRVGQEQRRHEWAKISGHGRSKTWEAIDVAEEKMMNAVYLYMSKFVDTPTC